MVSLSRCRYQQESLLAPPLLISHAACGGPRHNAQYDYLPPPLISPVHSPPCDIWRADRPRADLLCEGSALCHPLVSLFAAPSWEGSPPIFLSCGEELFADECKAFAQKVARQGAKIIWEQYEAMPHCFVHILLGSPTASRGLEGYANFITKVVDNTGDVSTNGQFFATKSLESSPVDVCNLSRASEKEVLERMQHSRDRILRQAQISK
ncbi:alpha/beta hydrolase [Aspergillus lucknowensis]|uniref:Alpha/beta hydrolase fold-3 domain-containing protein n=1 Tax=Aspergillus lucknowensis TaxID=176173 RepID=A0ABR4M2C0_9EURO